MLWFINFSCIALAVVRPVVWLTDRSAVSHILVIAYSAVKITMIRSKTMWTMCINVIWTSDACLLTSCAARIHGLRHSDLKDRTLSWALGYVGAIRLLMQVICIGTLQELNQSSWWVSVTSTTDPRLLIKYFCLKNTFGVRIYNSIQVCWYSH